MIVTILNNELNLDHEVFKAKTIKELKEKADLFGNLNDDQKNEAYDQLWDILHPNVKPPKVEKTTE